jgi:hypothetical protein
MTSIERRELQQRVKSGRVRTVVRYKIRYRDKAGRAHSETKRRLVDAERRRAEIELELTGGTWHDPRRGETRLSAWAAEWLLTRHDLRPTTHARLATTLARQVLPRFGATSLLKISNGAVRAWVAEMVSSGLSPTTVRKAVFALRHAWRRPSPTGGWRSTRLLTCRCRLSAPSRHGSSRSPMSNA